MSRIRIVTARAPGLLPGLMREIDRAKKPVVLIPESFTLACETEIVNHSPEGGFFDLRIYSPSSLVREVREMTGRGGRKPVSGAGQSMMISRLLHHHREELKYYRDSVAQPGLAAKIAGQIDDFTRARLTPEFLRGYRPASRRTGAKLADIALIWDGYRAELEQGFEDTVGQWISAVELIRESGILRGSQLLIYGFDAISHDILRLAEAAASGGEGAAEEVVIGLVSDDAGPDREIFRAAGESVRSLTERLDRRRIPYRVEQAEEPPERDAGLVWAEKNLFAAGAVSADEVPDLGRIHVHYARNSYIDCQYACQTLIDWHREGIAWEDMAVAVCEQGTLPQLLPLTLSAAGIPFNAKQDQPILMSAYAQFFLSLLRILRLNFCREDVLRMIKTGFTGMSAAEGMEMENYARANGIHRGRWLRPFRMPEKENDKAAVQRLEELRKQLTEPIEELRDKLRNRSCTGREAAKLLFDYITDAGAYERLLQQEEELAAQGDDLTIDRNRQVWTAVNELLDNAAAFIGDEPLPLKDLCSMLEASMASRMIKSLPQRSGAVMAAPPQMFFTSGVRCMIVMGIQENEIPAGAGILTEQERGRLEQYIAESNLEYDRQAGADALWQERPYNRIGQSAAELAARQKQDIDQALSLARERLVLSCSGARPSGGVMTPSAAFRRAQDAVQKQHPENVTGSLMESGLRPFAPVFALEALAVRLRDSRDREDGFLQGGGPEDLLWKNALGSLYQDEAWHTKVEGILRGLHMETPQARITPEQAGQLYQSQGMTISRVETFATCPWKHFTKHGLVLEPQQRYAFERHEQGTFHHDVIQMFLERAVALPEWPDLSENTVTCLLNSILKERTRKWEGGILTSDTVHRFQGACMIHGVRKSIESMMRAFRQKPHFLPMAAEVPFGTADEPGKPALPAVRIDTSDGGTIALSGRIDRIDWLETPDGKQYFLIVDNKMSQRELRENSVSAGLQLQLPLYIRAAENGLPGYRPAGGVYQPIRDVLTDGREPEEIRQKVDRELQPTGMILDDPEIQEAAKPMKISRKSDTNDTVSARTAEEIQELCDRTLSVIRLNADRIRSGEAAPRPVQDGAGSPCERCDHETACSYDKSLPGCAIPVIDHKRRTDTCPAEPKTV